MNHINGPVTMTRLGRILSRNATPVSAATAPVVTQKPRHVPDHYDLNKLGVEAAWLHPLFAEVAHDAA